MNDEPADINRDYVEPIPGVYIHKSDDVHATLDRLFPLPFFATLRAKYPGAFGAAPSPHLSGEPVLIAETVSGSTAVPVRLYLRNVPGEQEAYLAEVFSAVKWTPAEALNLRDARLFVSDPYLFTNHLIRVDAQGVIKGCAMHKAIDVGVPALRDPGRLAGELIEALNKYDDWHFTSREASAAAIIICRD